MRAAPLALLFFGLAAAAVGAISPEEAEFFEKRIRPVLVEQCHSCHGPEKQKAELRLDSREALLKGSDLGPVVVAGKPEESSLIKSIRHEGDSKMPEKADKLPDEQIAALAEWVKMGTPWPEETGAKTTTQQDAAKTHWSFQKVRDHQPPAVQDPQGWGSSSVDAFILAKLEAAGLQPSPKASRRVLIRRATFDLTGLPPTIEEVAAFEKDEAPDAFARVIDRLLASPRYGERWGRYWLDVARYADTKGYVFMEERRYPFAYTYRDWVVRALNNDLPYDQFLIQQIAADHLATGDDKQNLAAMGFLTLGRRFLNAQPDIIDDRIDVLSRGTMGLTVSCARCHDHKFDPIAQKDYYALYGVFASSIEPTELPLLGEKDPHATAEYEAELAKRKAKLSEFLGKKSLEVGLAATLASNVPFVLPPGWPRRDQGSPVATRPRYLARFAEQDRRAERRSARSAPRHGAAGRAGAGAAASLQTWQCGNAWRRSAAALHQRAGRWQAGALRERKRPVGVGAGDREPGESAHSARDGEPGVDASLRARARADAGGFRSKGRAADASRAARLSRGALRRKRLVFEEAAPADHALERIPADE
jgi:mono/diheme cytochrome c family protein